MDEIPLLDIPRQDADLREDILKEVEAVITAASFIGGDAVRLFEDQYAAFVGAAYCIGVANGTDAVELALRANGVVPGDEVVIPAFTFIATAEAVLRIGAVPVLVDVLPGTLLMDCDAAAAAITPRTRAVVPVHLYGQMAAVERLPADVAIVEDAAQSQGARRGGRSAGGVGAAAATSFYPGKNLGAYGDAGAVTTNDVHIATAVRRLANHGGLQRYEHDVPGMNSRLDTIQAAVLRIKLGRLAEWNESRRRVAARYHELLHDLEELALPVTAEMNEHVWHQYVIQVPDRDRVVTVLRAHGISAAVHYPQPLHLTGALVALGLGPGSFPVAEKAARRVVSLPMNPTLTEEEQVHVVEAVRRAVSGAGSSSR